MQTEKLKYAAHMVIHGIEEFDKKSSEAEHTDVGEVWVNLLRWKNLLQGALGVRMTGTYESREL